MTKIQNLWTNKKIFLGVLLILMAVIHVFAQNSYGDQPLSMLALGDSYTIGESVDVDERWPHHFVAELRKRGKEVLDPEYIATTGWTTIDLLEGMVSTLDRDKKYKLVSILIGVNNQYQGLDIGIYEPELRKIIEVALEISGGLCSRVFMLSIPDYAYTPFGKGDSVISREIDAYNEIGERVAREYGIAFFDITSISRKGLTEPNLVAKDGLHPSGIQYRKWVQKVLKNEAKDQFQNDSADFQQIKKIFYQQEEDWNKGDIDAFMQAYWHSEDLQFGGANGLTRGWKQTLERYKKSYPDRATMGKLSFQIKDMSRHAECVVSLTGSWELTRANDQPGGHFLLLWKKIDGQWKIVVDHTSQKLP